MSKLYATVTNTSGIISITTTESHDAAATTAMVTAVSTSLTLGDTVTIDLGYDDDHAVVFTGVVKQIERGYPDGEYIITAYDNMVKAQDYFIAAGNPEAPLTYQNISAEDLVTAIMGLAGLTVETPDPTFFTFGINNSFEVNLISAYDFCRMIGDTLTWSLWADINGDIQFANRKPYPMVDEYPENLQPGWAVDTPTSYVLTDSGLAIDISLTSTERFLRNRVVVYGNEGIFAEASDTSSVLPAGFYKSAVLAFPQIIDSTELAQDIADYNLALFNRTTESMSVTVLGEPTLHSRTVIQSSLPNTLGTSYDWYVFGCDHQWGVAGYVTSLELRRMIKA